MIANNRELRHRYFDKVVARYASIGVDLSYMDCRLSTMPRYNDGSVSFEIPPEEFGGSWTKNRIVYINRYPERVVEHWGLDMTVPEFVEWIIAHELGHEVWKNVASEEMKRFIVNRAARSGFTTAYLETVPKHKRNEETFCEYMAFRLTGV